MLKLTKNMHQRIFEAEKNGLDSIVIRKEKFNILPYPENLAYTDENYHIVVIEHTITGKKFLTEPFEYATGEIRGSKEYKSVTISKYVVHLYEYEEDDEEE